MSYFKRYFKYGLFLLSFCFLFTSVWAKSSWSTEGQESVKTSDKISDVSLKYIGEDEKFLKFEFDYNGPIYKYNYFNLPKPDDDWGWTHYLLNFDEDLFSKIDLFRSYAQGDYSHRLEKDYYDLTSNFSTEKTSYFLRLSQIFKESDKASNHKATIYLAKKKGVKFNDYDSYKIQSRIARKARANNWKFFLIKYQLRKFDDNNFTYDTNFRIDKKENYIEKAPNVEDIYTGDNLVKGNTNLGNDVYVKLTRLKRFGEDNDKFIYVYPGKDGSFNAPIDRLDDLKKDDIIEIRNVPINGTATLESKPTIKKVKARVNFNYNDTKRSVDVPENNLSTQDKDYIPNGLGYSMIDNPQVRGKKFLGWVTKKDYTGSYENLKELSNTSEMKENEVYKFTNATKIEKSIDVYGVFEDEKESVKIVLHSNYGTGNESTKEINISYGDLADYYKMIEVNTFDEQRQNANSYSPKAILPDMYTYKLKKAESGTGNDSSFEKKEFYKDGYTFVGWSLEKDNGNMPIEGYYDDDSGKGEHHKGLFENMSIVVQKNDGYAREFYMTTVEAHGDKFTDKVTKRRKLDRVYPKNGVIDLYAAWKPEYEIKLKDEWYGVPKKADDNKYSIKSWLNALAHDTPGYSDFIEKYNDKKPIQIGLLYRTAVTEAERPTVTGEANFFTIAGSLKDSSKTDFRDFVWHYPAYDEHGKRFSFVAVALDPGDEGVKKYETFNQVWSNIWTTVGDNLASPERWEEGTIAKTQLIVTPNKDNGVDAFTSATVRKWKDNEQKVIVNGKEDIRQKPIVSSEGHYNITLINIQSKLQSPEIRTPFGGDNFFYISKNSDPKVDAMMIELPEHIYRPVYLVKENGNWVIGMEEKDTSGNLTKIVKNTHTPKEDSIARRVKLSNETIEGREYIKVTVLDPNGRDPLKNEPGSEPLATFRIGQTLRITSLSKNNPMIRSNVSIVKFAERGTSGYLRGLNQLESFTKDGKEYVVVSGDKPTEDLGLLSDNADITLVKKVGNDYVNISKKEIKGYEIGNKYYFEVEKDLLKHGDIVTAKNKDGDKKVTYSPGAINIDLEAPKIKITTPLTFSTEDDIYRDGVITSDSSENVYLEMVENNDDFIFEKNNSVNSWAISRASLPEGKYFVKLKAKDRFGNLSDEQTLEINVKKGYVDDNKLEVSQQTKENGYYRIKVSDKSGFKNGDRILVYSNDKVIAQEDVNSKENLTEVILRIDPSEKENIKTPLVVELIRANNRKKTQELNEFIIDGPQAVKIDTENPGINNKKVKISKIDEKATRIDVKVDGVTKTLTKENGEWMLDEKKLTETYGKYEVEFENAIGSGTSISVIAYDEFLNETPTYATMDTLTRPQKPHFITAIVNEEGKTELGIEIDKDKLAYVNGFKIYYDGKVIRTIAKDEFNSEGYFKFTYDGELLLHPIYAAAVSYKGVESERAKTFAIDNKPEKPKEQDTSMYDLFISNLSLVVEGDEVKITGQMNKFIEGIEIRFKAYDDTIYSIYPDSADFKGYFYYDEVASGDSLRIDLFDSNGKFHYYYKDKDGNITNVKDSSGNRRKDAPQEDKDLYVDVK